MMKKLGMFCCIVMLVFGVTGTASALNLGTWDLNTDGEWVETFVPALGTAVLNAWDVDSQWALSNLIMIDTYDDDGIHVNTYAGGTLALSEELGSWGEAVSIGNVGMVSYGIQTPVGANVSMEVFGTHQGLDILISAEFVGIFGHNFFFDPDAMQYSGVGFESATMEIVPEPGTMLLFGAGLVGLVVLSRKRFLNR